MSTEIDTRVGMALDQHAGYDAKVVEGLTLEQLGRCDWKSVTVNHLQLGLLDQHLIKLIEHWSTVHSKGGPDGEQVGVRTALRPHADGATTMNRPILSPQSKVAYGVSHHHQGGGIVFTIDILFVPPTINP